MYQIFALIFAISWTNLYAAEGFTDFSLGLGNLTQFVQDIQTKDDGEDLNTWDTNLYLEVNFKIVSDKFPNWALYPQFGILFPQHGRDENIRKNAAFGIGNLAYHYKKFSFRLGTGFFFTRISSKGGTIRLNNGNGYDDFHLPEEASVARNLITVLGVQYQMHRLWSAKAELIGYNLEDSDDRAVSYTLSAHYHFGDIFHSNFWSQK